MTKPGPGKFEGCESLEVAEFLYNITMDFEETDSLADENGRCIALIAAELFEIPYKDEGKGIEFKPWYITEEDSNGFFTYFGYDTKDEAYRDWDAFAKSFNESLTL